MATVQVDATRGEDVITEVEESPTKVVAPPQPSPEMVKSVDEEEAEDLTAPAYEEKAAENSDKEEEVEYSPFVEEAPEWYAAGEPAATFNEDDDNTEDDDDF